MDWDEKKYEHIEEIKKSQMHDCIGDRKNCDSIHPNVANFTALIPSNFRPNQNHPPAWRNWVLDGKFIMTYVNRHTARLEAFNLSEAFSQMASNGKINVVHGIIEYCLDDDERSLLFSDLTN